MPEERGKPSAMAKLAEAYLRARELREQRSAGEYAEPMLWMLLGLLLMACFFLALTTLSR